MNTSSRRTNRVRLLPDKKAEAVLKTMGIRVSVLWNVANYRCRQAFLSGKQVPAHATLCSEFKDHDAYRALPSHVGQEVLKKVAHAWKSYFALRRKWKSGEIEDKPGLPRYRKAKGGRPWNWIPLMSTAAYGIESRHVTLTLPPDLRVKDRLRIPYRGCRRHVGPIKSADLYYDAGRKRWYLNYRVEHPQRKPRPWIREAAIDLGIRVAASLSIDGVAHSHHFLGRHMLKDWDYWGRRIAEHQAELSSRGLKDSRRLKRLYGKRLARWTHAWESLAGHIAAILKAHRVGCVYVGWPKDIRRETRYSRLWNGRIHNFWAFEKAIRILEKHCIRHGIVLHRVGERGTSSTCPGCGSRKVVRHPRHVLRCRVCGLAMHSDQAGSRNILLSRNPGARFGMKPGSNRDGAEAAPRPVTYRWDRHRWVSASNPLLMERPAA